MLPNSNPDLQAVFGCTFSLFRLPTVQSNMFLLLNFLLHSKLLLELSCCLKNKSCVLFSQLKQKNKKPLQQSNTSPACQHIPSWLITKVIIKRGYFPLTFQKERKEKCTLQTGSSKLYNINYCFAYYDVFFWLNLIKLTNRSKESNMNTTRNLDAVQFKKSIRI